MKEIESLPVACEMNLQVSGTKFNQSELISREYKNACIHQLFESQVERTPDNVAVVYQGQQLTYRQLNALVNQLAHHLRNLGVKPEVLVGLCLERSLEMVIGLLAILKAGGAYVPLDPTYPRERLVNMLADAQMPVLLTTQSIVSRLLSDCDPKTQISMPKLVVCLDKDWEVITQKSQENLVNQNTPDHLAYVIYTSGSTGIPKGVMIEHQCLVNYVQTAAIEYELKVSDGAGAPAIGDRILQFASISFDAAAEEIFPCLIQGATLVLRTDEMLSTASEFLQQCENLGITVLGLPTAFWHYITAELFRANLALPKSLRLVIIGGERAKPERFAMWQQQVGNSVRLVNTYGPTETTIVATMCDLTREHAVETNAELPIGHGIRNVQTYVLDEYSKPVPVGVAGELYIGGAGVARGYLNRPQLTAEKFVKNPFTNNSRERLYKTGDLVRYRIDGNIEFLGRIDHQVKIRGFRVELFEIEAVLGQHPAVQEAVVIAREDISDHKHLVAYVVPNWKSKVIEMNTEQVLQQEIPASKLVSVLRKYIKSQLPNYMLPSTFVILEKLPLTVSGKVDRQKLPKPEYSRLELEDAYVKPRTFVEEKIAKIWTKVLGIENVGVYDNFFELGGNSLLAAQLISNIRETFQVELFTRRLYETPTIEGLAEAVEKVYRGDVATLSTILNLEAEAVLPPEIDAKLDEPEYIFLTGATGFLGTFLLYELLQQTQASIYCLVRCANENEGFKRLQKSLEKYLLWDESLSYRIIPVPGDLAQPLLGISIEKFEKLAEQVDSIYHNGALVNFVQPYSALKSANVLGTHEILKLACRGKVKPIHYISTVTIFGPIGYFTNAKIVPENQDINISKDYLCWDDGYAQSKWVAEKIIGLAKTRGLPITIFRPGFIMGHSHTGVTNTNDYVSRLIKGCIQLGSCPELINHKEQLIPIDYASRAIVHLSRRKKSLGKAFHLTPPPSQDILLSDLFDMVSSYGYQIKKMSYAQWKSELIKQTKSSKDNALCPLLPLLSEKIYQNRLSVMELYQNTPDFDCQNTLAGLAGTSIVCPSIDAELLDTYFSYFIRSGFLDSPPNRTKISVKAKGSRLLTASQSKP